MCTTTTHYETHISTECSTGGTGQCDGFCIEHGAACTCACHNANDLPQTVQGVRDWHDEAEGIVASFEQGDQAEQWSTAQAWIDRLVRPTKEYKVLAGQGRTVVAERYL